MKTPLSRLQLTDEVAKELMSGCSGTEDLTRRMEEAERMEAHYVVMQRMRMELCQQLAGLVEVEVSDFYFNEVASNEYQRQLLTGQEQVPHLCTSICCGPCSRYRSLSFLSPVGVPFFLMWPGMLPGAH